MALKKTARRRTESPTEDKSSGKPKKQSKHRERLGKGVKIALVAVGIFAMLLSVSTMAIAGFFNQSASSKPKYELTGGVAATVNGVNIKEDSVTQQIMQQRESGGNKTDKKWAQYLVNSNQTPKDLRETTIRSLAKQYLITEAEQKNNITVTADDIDAKWKEQVANYGSEAKFVDQIKKAGMTESSYKNSLKNGIMLEKLKAIVAKGKKPSDKDIVEAVNKDLKKYNDARRSSNILFKVKSGASDAADAKVKKNAQKVLDKINAKKLSFKDAVKKYSQDEGSKKEHGDVGWDKLTSFVTEYQDALTKLSNGQMSGLVKSTYGYHIILCTGYFHVDDSVTSIDQIPSNLKSKISDTLKTSNESTAYTTWLDGYVKKAKIKINKMPKNVPYNVSLDGVKKPDGSGSKK